MPGLIAAIFTSAFSIVPPAAHASVISFEAPRILDSDTLLIESTIATDAQGTWVVVWTSKNGQQNVTTDEDVYFVRSTDNARTFGAVERLNATAPDAAQDFGADVGVNGSGTWMAVWSTKSSFGGTIGVEGNVVYATSVDGGATWSAPAVVNTDAATDGDRDDSATITGRGSTWIAVWRRHNEPSYGQLVVARSIDDGATWQQQILASDMDIHAGRMRAVGDGAGNWLLAAVKEISSSDHRLLVFRSADDGQTWSAPLEVIQDAVITSPVVETDRSGTWMLTVELATLIEDPPRGWRTAYALSADDGATWSPPALVDLNSTLNNPEGALGPNHATTLVYDAQSQAWLCAFASLGRYPYDQTDSDILFSTANAPTFAWRLPIALNSDANEDERDFEPGLPSDRQPSIATDGAGTFAASYTSFVEQACCDTEVRVAVSVPDCPAAPAPGCRQATPAGASSLTLRSSPGFKDFVTWKWKGEATDFADFGNPTTTDRYALCLYDESSGTPGLIFEKEIPVGGSCDGKSCWRTGSNGFRYVGGPTKPTSIRSVDLRAGADGKAKILVRAGGIAAGPPPLPLAQDSSVVAHLVNTATGECWSASYPTALKNDETRFIAKVD